MKRHFFGRVFFYCFFGLQIYEAIAAIFWQSASCVSSWRHEQLAVPNKLVNNNSYLTKVGRI